MSAKRDALRSLVVAGVLVAAAAAAVFVVRPGESLETRIAWMFALLPGALPGNIAAQAMWPHSSATAVVVGFTLTFALSIGWYFLLCFGAMRGWQMLVRRRLS